MDDITGRRNNVNLKQCNQNTQWFSFELSCALCPVSPQYMEKEEAMNVLQFWLAADNFQNQLAAKKGQYDGQEAQNDAMILYDK